MELVYGEIKFQELSAQPGRRVLKRWLGTTNTAGIFLRRTASFEHEGGPIGRLYHNAHYRPFFLSYETGIVVMHSLGRRREFAPNKQFLTVLRWKLDSNHVELMDIVVCEPNPPAIRGSSGWWL